MYHRQYSDGRTMKLEVLVATMHQKNMTLVERMNVQQSVVIANQCGNWNYFKQKKGEHTVSMFSSDTVGVGLNRNFALQLASADILLFADDDVRYYDADLSGVIRAFEELPQADVIVFGMDMTRDGKIYEKRRCKTAPVFLWNSMKYGTYRIAVRRRSIQSKNIVFSVLFGGGCVYGSGEDSLFLRDCFRKGLKVYSHEYVLGTCAKDQSSWFTGYNQKYMFDKGAWTACAFPKIKHLIKWYFIFRCMRLTELSLREVIYHFNRGIRLYPQSISYQKAISVDK